MEVNEMSKHDTTPDKGGAMPPAVAIWLRSHMAELGRKTSTRKAAACRANLVRARAKKARAHGQDTEQ